MLNKSKLGTQFLLGYGIVLALMIAIAVTSYVGLKAATTGFNEYRSLARDSNLAGRIQANMLLTRLNFRQYILSHDDVDIADYRDRFDKLVSFLDIAKSQIEEPERLALIEGIDQQVLLYNQAFDQVVELMKRRDDVVFTRLDPNGLKLRTAVTELTHLLHDTDEAEGAYLSGELQEAVLLGRLYAVKFLNTNAAADRVRALKELDENVANRAKKLRGYVNSPELSEVFAEVNASFKAYRLAFSDIADIISKRNALIEGTLDVIGEKVASDAEEVKLSVLTRQDIIGPQVKSENESVVKHIFLLCLASLFIGALSAFLVFRIIKKSLASMGGEPCEMEEIASDIAGGDLTLQLERSEASTGVYAAMENMVCNLRRIVSDVNDTAAELNAGAAEISRGNSELNKRTEHQAASLQNAASSMEQITSIVKNNADHAREARILASAACDQAQAGGLAVNKTVEAMSTINNSSSKIASITSVINEISFQTNLLALNAAVEAARAGEQGRGFAVVAGEVRALAQRSAAAAGEISALIDESVAEVKVGAALVDDSGKALEEIVSSVQRVSTIISDIAIASDEQSLGIQEIDKVIRAVDDITQKNTELVDLAANNSLSVEQQASKLSGLMSQFRL